jgi:hypothetical protein
MNSDFDLKVWRHIRDEGGWHSREEIAKSLNLDARGKMRLAHALRRLHKSGAVVARVDMAGRDRFGVTTRCLMLDEAGEC